MAWVGFPLFVSNPNLAGLFCYFLCREQSNLTIVFTGRGIVCCAVE
jgi:hypothetical protein